MPRTSWAERVAARARTLSADSAQVAALVTALRCAVQEWVDDDAAAGRTVQSGITADGDPVELSVKHRPDTGEADLRFIAQPGRVGVPLPRDRAFIRRRAAEFASRYAGVNAAAFVAAVTAAFPVDDDVGIGNFFLWLGLDLQTATTPVVKVYLNPWACAVADRGLPFAESVMAMANLGSVVPAMRTLVAMQVPALPHIVGLNLDADGVCAMKLYFPLRVALAPGLRRIARAFRGTDRFVESLERIAPHTWGVGGEVHAALMWSRGIPEPRFRASLYCPDWFASDDDVLAAARAVDDALELPLARPAAGRGRWFTFLGIDDASTVLYSHV